ncbi:hypothetical protein PHAVU_001G139250 [Phaseolus vulgaris]
MSVARNIIKNPKLVPGGGATELTVSAALKQKSSSIEGIEKWPYEAAAIAFESIPRTLAQNCGVNVIRTMTALQGKHANGENTWIGIDGNTGSITDMKEGKIWDAYNVKAQAFKTAIEAACMLLRIDDIVSGIKKKQALELQVLQNPRLRPRQMLTMSKSFLIENLGYFPSGNRHVFNSGPMGHGRNHEQVLTKVREEIDAVVGFSRLVTESDLPNLPYLQAVVKEVLRLHPTAPFALRESAEDCTINGYDIKSQTRTLINVYAIMRDPEEWANPEEFIPERFLVDDSDETRVVISGTFHLDLGGGDALGLHLP